ncbi:hypothetical protein [Nocardia sp. CA-119907]|uniref:hypothetical protein n=1 Tax=Nocardia sp. CA-119907 TaxID=3239973 RepID=UPI003D98C2D2
MARPLCRAPAAFAQVGRDTGHRITARGKQALLGEIAADAKAQGAQHHRFVPDGKQIVVIAEWDTPESFQTFFTDNAKIAVTKDAGIQVGACLAALVRCTRAPVARLAGM